MSAEPSPVADLVAKVKALAAAHLTGGVIEGLSARERRLLDRLVAVEPTPDGGVTIAIDEALAVAIEAQR